VGAVVDHIVASHPQVLNEGLLEVKASVVRSNVEAHGSHSASPLLAERERLREAASGKARVGA